MRIADAYSKMSLDKTAVSSAQATKGASSGKAAAQRPGNGGDAVKVTVSAQARELANRAGDSFDAAKVDRLKSAIDAGSYKVDARAVADRIVEG